MKALYKLTFCEPRDFIHLFLEKNELHPYFTVVRDKFSNNIVYNSTGTSNLKDKKHHYLFFDIPGYYKTVPDSNFAQKNVKSFKGSLIHLTRYQDFQQFFKHKFSSKQRAELLRQKRNLHRSFEVRHRVYYGSIQREVYDQLFGQFKEMLIIRFLEKGIKNDDLNYWKHYHNIFYELVNTKRACISVLYEKNDPISFSVNLIYGDTVYGYLKSYDIDYAKYSLGTLEMMSLLEWAYGLQLSKFDLLKGQYAYKSRLIDEEYYFIKSIITQRASKVSTLLGLITYVRVSLFYKTIRVLKLLRADRFYHSVYRKWYSWKHPKKSSLNYRIKPHEEDFKEGQIMLIDRKSSNYKDIRRALFDFVFSSGDSLEDVEVFQVLSEARTFFFKGKEHSRVIQIGSNSLNSAS